MALVALSTVLSANTYYVAPSGGKDSDPGTLAQPWATWQKAFDTARAGDTVYFRGGIWYPTSYALHDPSSGHGFNGTYSNPICFFNYPGEEPIFDASKFSGGGGLTILIDYSTYLKFRGLTIRNHRQVGGETVVGMYMSNAGNLYLERVTSCWNGGHGFQAYGYDTLNYINCDSYHNADTITGGNTADGFAGGSGGTENDTLKYTSFYGCRAWANSDDGFDLGTTKQIFLSNCWAFLNGDPSLGTEAEGDGIKTNPSNVRIPGKRRIQNCLSAFNTGAAFSHQNLTDTFHGPVVDWVNNTAYKCRNGIVFSNDGFNQDLGGGRVNFRNNIVYGMTEYYTLPFVWTSLNYVTQQNNNIIMKLDYPYYDLNPIVTVTDADFELTDRNTGIAQLTAARKSDGSLPDVTFLKLKVGSDLIDAGIDVGLSYNGNAPDIGYSEYTGGSVTNPSPIFVSAVIENATPSRLDMAYNLTLANTVPAASAFTVMVNSSARSVSSVSVSGTKVSLALASPIVYGNTVTVAYTKPSTNPLQTAAGGQAASITAQNVTNNVAAVIPVYLSSVVENSNPSRLDMTYNLALANTIPPTSAFTVMVNSSARSVSSVSVSGAKVSLTLASPIVYGNTVTVAYTKPSTNPLQTAAGGQAASITAQNVTNNVATVIPAYVSSVVENATPSRLEMTYNLTLANIVPAVSAFTVMVNSSARTVSSVTISGTKVLLTLASPVVYGDAVTVAYTKPSTNPLQTAQGGQAASKTAQNVTNNVATVIPAYVSSVVENATPSRLEMTYNLTLANIVPAASAFTVMVNSSARTVSSVTISGTKVLLTLASPVVYGDAVTVAYTKPSTNPLQTAQGGQAASKTAQNVTNNVATVIPAYVSSVVENATPSRLEMTYNLTLANIVPAASAFTVMVNSSARGVNAISISGAKVLLTLSSPIVYNDVVTVAYTKPSTNPLQTAQGGQAASITAQNVTNNVAVVLPVYLSSAIENATPSRLDMTYNLTLASTVPATSAFTVMVNSSARSVSSVSVSGTKVSLTLASPIVYGNTVTVAYAKPSTNPLQTAQGGQAASITAQNVTNNVAVVLPVYLSSAIENATPSRLDMTYNLTLASTVPATSAFTVMVNSSARSVSSVSVSGTKVSLTLASPIVYGNTVTVAYAKPSTNPLQTAQGGQAASITAQSVINNCSLANNQPPVVAITSPTKSITFVAPATITIEAIASDPDGSIIKVEFYNGSTKLGESSMSPFSFTWKEVPAGTYSITAVATDNLNAKSISATVNVIVETPTNTVNQLPIVTISKPNKGKSHNKHDNVVIEAVASDPDGTISMVEFKSGNVTLAQITTAPYIYIWEDIDTGTYIITAIATDNRGATSSSSDVEFVVIPGISSEINLYPNPNDGHFSIDITSNVQKNSIVTIVNSSGKTVYNGILNEEEFTKQYDLSRLTPGNYILTIRTGKTILAAKQFIKR